MMNSQRYIGTVCLVFFAALVFAQAPGYFNHGRTRSFGGGISLSPDGKTLFHTELIKDDSLKGGRYQIVKSTWSNGSWSAPIDLHLTSSGHEVSPVLSPDSRRLYFASTAPGPGETEEGDLNIWYTEISERGASAPVFLSDLNTDMADRFTHVDAAENFYMISNKASGNQDVMVTRFEKGNWTTPAPITEWNSPKEEEYVSVNSKLGIAFLQRSTPGVETELFYSLHNNDSWTIPQPLAYDAKNTQFPYVHRAPMLSPDGGTFYLVAHALVWQQSAAELFRQNNIDRKASAYQPLTVPTPSAAEPQVFGGLKLKTNNGITFSPDMKSVYVSRYTAERDSSGSQFMKIFESKKKDNVWSDFVLAPFCKPGVPFEYHPVLDPTGKRLFYNSRAPIAGSDVPFVQKNNPWYVERNGYTWSAPVMIGSLATEDYDDYVSVATSGNLYFRSDRPGGKGAGDIYMSRYSNGVYTAPELVDALNSEHNENDLCVDPMERFIIFNRYHDRTREIKLYLSIKSGNEWQKPRIVAQLERTSDWELTPSLSPDGKYFFYEINSNILFVETKTLFTAEEWKKMNG